MNFTSRKKIIGVLISVILCFYSGNLFGQTAQEIGKRGLFSTVTLRILDTDNEVISYGSGFFYRPNRIVTNYHVIKGGAKAYFKLINDDTWRPISGINSIDTEKDFAILHVDYMHSKVLTGANNEFTEIGETIYVVGAPMGLEGTFSQGIVSSVRSIHGNKHFQITAPISSGSSGGPVLNSKGFTIGVATSSLVEGQNLNFALSMDYIYEWYNSPIVKPFTSQFIDNPDLIEIIPTVKKQDEDYKVGHIGPAGGYVFYDKGFYSNGWRYLEIAPEGWFDNNEDPFVEIGCNEASFATKTGIGDGKGNTELINRKCCCQETFFKSAISIINSLKINGYEDWFIPSRDELDLVYKNVSQKGIAGISSTPRWYISSSITASKAVFNQELTLGILSSPSISSINRLRPIRSF